MKIIKIIAVLFFISKGANAQNKNFTVDNSLINWKYIYEDSTNLSELKKNYKLEFTSKNQGIIKKGSINNPKIKDELTAEFFIDEKPGKYRVTVTNIRFFNTMQLQLSMVSTNITDYPIETSWLKKDGTIRDKYFGISLTEILNTYFTDLFTIKPFEKKDW